MIENVSNILDAAINEDVSFQKKPLDLRNQRTYAVRVGLVESQLDRCLWWVGWTKWVA